MSVESDLNAVLRNLNAFVIEMTDAGREAAEEIGELLVGYAKTHHLWQPQTGQTELTTQAVIEEVNGMIEVALTTETDYSTFLELARNGRFAWLWPAMDANKGAIVEIMRRRLGRKRRESL
jgi:hypothetical protein